MNGILFNEGHWINFVYVRFLCLAHYFIKKYYWKFDKVINYIPLIIIDIYLFEKKLALLLWFCMNQWSELKDELVSEIIQYQSVNLRYIRLEKTLMISDLKINSVSTYMFAWKSSRINTEYVLRTKTDRFPNILVMCF